MKRESFFVRSVGMTNTRQPQNINFRQKRQRQKDNDSEKPVGNHSIRRVEEGEKWNELPSFPSETCCAIVNSSQIARDHQATFRLGDIASNDGMRGMRGMREEIRKE